MTNKVKPLPQQHMITLEIQGFILDRQSRGLSDNTILFYRNQLAKLQTYCHNIEDIIPQVIRQGMIDHGHAWYRAVKAFCMWYEKETDGEWKNPIHKVSGGKVKTDPLPGITLDNIRLMIAACAKTSYGLRNKVIMLMLIDTGMRVSELCALNVEDITLETGEVHILHGKGDKPRSVFIGVRTRRELVKYLRKIQRNHSDPLFYGKTSLERITRRGVATMLEFVANKAGVPAPTPHDFRRAFTRAALQYTDVITVSRMLGHSTTQVVWRYYYQNKTDLQKAHEKASPADRL